MKITSLARAGVLAAAVALAAPALSACGTSSATSSPGTTPATTPPTSNPTATTAQATTVVVASTATATSPACDRAAALAAWKKGAVVSSAVSNKYLRDAAADLSAAKALGADPTTYGTAIAQLDELQTIPETDVTAAQMTAARNDTRALDGFFGTRGLYGVVS